MNHLFTKALKRSKSVSFFIALLLSLPTVASAELNVATTISGNSGLFISTRYMRHVVLTNQNASTITKPVVIVQKSALHDKNLELYTGSQVDWESSGSVIPQPLNTDGTPKPYSYQQNLLISDSVIDGDAIIVAYSALRDEDIIDPSSGLIKEEPANAGFSRMTFNPQENKWEAQGLASLPLASSQIASRTTIAIDDLGRYWCAARIYEESTTASPGLFYIKIFVSENKGQNWQAVDGQYGSVNQLANKNPRIFAQSAGIAMVYHDVYLDASNQEVKRKALIYRAKLGNVKAAWPAKNTTIFASYRAQNDSYGSHWSIVSDMDENLHVAYQNADKGIQYVFLKKSQDGVIIEQDLLLSSDEGWVGAYPSLAASTDDNEVALVVSEERPKSSGGYDTRIIWKHFYPGDIDNSDWNLIRDVSKSRLRMISAEDYSAVNGLTLFYEVSGSELTSDGNYQLYVNDL